MDYRAEYERWINSNKLSEEELSELLAIRGNEAEIEDRFYAPLTFGTAGLRGVLGMGINRMNAYTVRQATQGLAALICSKGREAMRRGVAIAMDCRHGSKEFSREAACVLAANGIRVYLFESMRPTPELSFAIRAMDCIAGINITASHNTKEYNGYKAYWEDGAQLPPKEAATVLAEIEKTDIFDGIKRMDYDRALKRGLITIIGEEVDEAFLHHALSCVIDKDAAKVAGSDMKIVYTPFHGTGYKLVPEALRRMGFKNIISVPEQSIPDGDFPTVKSPNPENREGFDCAVRLAKKEDVDLIIGTDPDADRVGVVVRNRDGEYVTISGNQMGVLLLDYIIRAKKKLGELPENAYVVKTIVTTELARRVCEMHGVKIHDTFTGFKFIAEKVEEMGSDGFIMGYEESYGYLVGDFCRDKDAVTASVIIAEMAASYRLSGMTLYDALQELFEKYGCFEERTINVIMPGLSGIAQRKKLMEKLRNEPPREIAGVAVSRVRDYLKGIASDGEQLGISGSDVLYFELSDDTRFIIRPSGTEPKIKVYVLAHGSDAEATRRRADDFAAAARELAN